MTRTVNRTRRKANVVVPVKASNKLTRSFQWAIKRVHHHAAFHHTHHLAYCVYYGIALAEDHGIQMIVVGVLFLSAVVVALAGEEF